MISYSPESQRASFTQSFLHPPLSQFKQVYSFRRSGATLDPVQPGIVDHPVAQNSDSFVGCRCQNVRDSGLSQHLHGRRPEIQFRTGRRSHRHGLPSAAGTHIDAHRSCPVLCRPKDPHRIGYDRIRDIRLDEECRVPQASAWTIATPGSYRRREVSPICWSRLSLASRNAPLSACRLASDRQITRLHDRAVSPFERRALRKRASLQSENRSRKPTERPWRARTQPFQ